MAQALSHISVYGAGSWGTALALQLARNGLEVLLWDYSPEHVRRIAKHRENRQYLPGIPFPDNLQCTTDIEALISFSPCQLVVVPSHGFRSLLTRLAGRLGPDHYLIWATKGLELDSGKLLHEVVEEVWPDGIDYGVVSGPTFAGEVARGLPTAMTVAATSTAIADEVAASFKGETSRVYTSQDVLGVELGGAVKNVLAIAAGISDGLGFGANARAALITRGLAEMVRLVRSMGANEQTIMGLAGVGDLVLTCTDDQSRNRRLGLAVGQGQAIDEAIEEIGQAVEGYKSSQSINTLAEKAGVEMPICREVNAVLYKGLPPHQAVKELLSRQQKAEY